MRIPAVPGSLWLPVVRRWDGGPGDPALGGCWCLAASRGGLELQARFPLRPAPRIPDAPPGTRVAELFTYDVAECFIAGADERYLELELGAGGHFLVLGFQGARNRVAEHAELALEIDFRRDAETWCSRTQLPWALLPQPPWRLNAYAIFGTAFLAFAPLPGEAPDFHQPDCYVPVEVESV